MAQLVLLAAGLPSSMLGPLLKKIKSANSDIEIIPTLPLKTRFYTNSYADDLYKKAVLYFKRTLNTDRMSRWDVDFVVLYVRYGSEQDRYLTERFDLEALLLPISIKPPTSKAPRKHNVNRIVNQLFQDSKRVLSNGRKVLLCLAREVRNRETRTCVLLPRGNFGSGFIAIKNSVHKSVESTTSAMAIERTLRGVEKDLSKNGHGRFIGRGLVFHAPAKAAARHGIAPMWCMLEHNASCVIRGRIRFGVCYDPRFHYDCDLGHTTNRRFVSCHEEKVLKPGRKHVNIAPNDNIR